MSSGPPPGMDAVALQNMMAYSAGQQRQGSGSSVIGEPIPDAPRWRFRMQVPAISLDFLSWLPFVGKHLAGKKLFNNGPGDMAVSIPKIADAAPGTKLPAPGQQVAIPKMPLSVEGNLGRILTAAFNRMGGAGGGLKQQELHRGDHAALEAAQPTLTLADLGTFSSPTFGGRGGGMGGGIDIT